jgi:hypothetical protein
MHRKQPDPARRVVFLTLLVLAAGPWAAARAQTNPPESKDGNTRGGMSADGLLNLLQSRQDGAKVAKWLEESFAGQPMPESAQMLAAVARGSRMGPGEGWFHPGQSRYGWRWLADRHGIRPSGGIPRDKFVGPKALFDRLDRDRDGELRADDFDWSERSAYAQQTQITNYLFSRMSRGGDGQLTREQWLKFFDEAARGKDHLDPQDFWAGLMGGPRPKGMANDMPSPQMLVRGLFSGELGSMQEGPKLNDPAPDFTLKSHDGKGSIRLGDLLGHKPVVLVFGSFT